MATPIMQIEVQDGAPAPLDAMTIAAMQRQQLHEKILRLRALREASETNNTAKGKKAPGQENGTHGRNKKAPEG